MATKIRRLTEDKWKTQIIKPTISGNSCSIIKQNDKITRIENSCTVPNSSSNSQLGRVMREIWSTAKITKENPNGISDTHHPGLRDETEIENCGRSAGRTETAILNTMVDLFINTRESR